MKKHIPRGAPPLLAVLLLLGFLFSRCDKPPDLTEEEKLPAATQEGKGTFGCLVDGKAWVPKSGGLLQPGIEPVYNEITGQFGILANRERLQYVGISCEGQIVKSVGDYYIPQDYLLVMDTSTICPEFNNTSVYYCKAGEVTIEKLDIISGIISGTFNFDAYSIQCQDTITITQGRFDIRYK
jgi:hypothetical protein